MAKGQIVYDNGKYRYFDKNGEEIFDGDSVKYDGEGSRTRIRKVYTTEDGELGIDATNPAWIESGRAVECEYGIYPFEQSDMAMVVKC